MAYCGFKKPTNKIVVVGEPKVQEQKIGGTVTNAKPGRLCAASGNDDDIVVGDGILPVLGWIGFEQGYHAKTRPANVDTAYAANDYVPVLYDGDFVIISSLAPGFSVKKGDRLASWGNGELAKAMKVNGGVAIGIPFAKSTGEKDTGVDLPEGAIVRDVFIEVTTAVESGTIDVGLLYAEDTNGGDADGFLDAESCAVTGFVKHNNVALTSAAATLTLGAYLKEADIADATASAGAQTYRVPNYHVVGEGQVSVSYTTSEHAIAGVIWIVIDSPGVEIVARAEQSLAVATVTDDETTTIVGQDIMVTSLL